MKPFEWGRGKENDFLVRTRFRMKGGGSKYRVMFSIGRRELQIVWKSYMNKAKMCKLRKCH